MSEQSDCDNAWRATIHGIVGYEDWSILQRQGQRFGFVAAWEKRATEIAALTAERDALIKAHGAVCDVARAEVAALKVERGRLRREFDERFTRKVKEMSDATGSMMVDLTCATVENETRRREVERLTAEVAALKVERTERDAVVAATEKWRDDATRWEKQIASDRVSPLTFDEMRASSSELRRVVDSLRAAELSPGFADPSGSGLKQL